MSDNVKDDLEVATRRIAELEAALGQRDEIIYKSFKKIRDLYEFSYVYYGKTDDWEALRNWLDSQREGE